MTREYTVRLRELLETGLLNHKEVLEEWFNYASEADVKSFCLESFAGEIAELFKDLE